MTDAKNVTSDSNAAGDDNDKELDRKVTIFARMRPLDEGSDIDPENCPVQFRFPSADNDIKKEQLWLRDSKGKETKSFEGWDGLIPTDWDEDQIFDASIKPACDRVLQGKHSIVMSYGQTGAGKTHTLLGVQGDKDTSCVNKGMAYKAIRYLLENEDDLQITMQAFECYLEDVFDLYDADDKHGRKLPKEEVDKIMFATGEGYLKGFSKRLKMREVTKDNIQNLLIEGFSHIHIGCTGCNSQSSRGFVLFLCHIIDPDGSRFANRTAFIFCDLAGTEGLKAVQATQKLRERSQTSDSDVLAIIGYLKYEARYITQELNQLGQQLKDFNNGRELNGALLICTRILTKFLFKQANATVLFHFRQDDPSARAAKSTIKFAEQIRDMPSEIEPIYDTNNPDELRKELERLQMQNNSLKKRIKILEGEGVSSGGGRTKGSVGGFLGPLKVGWRDVAILQDNRMGLVRWAGPRNGTWQLGCELLSGPSADPDGGPSKFDAPEERVIYVPLSDCRSVAFGAGSLLADRLDRGMSYAYRNDFEG